MYFCRGSLPWQGLPAKNKKQKYQKITEKKSPPLWNNCVKDFHVSEYSLWLRYFLTIGHISAEFVTYLKYTKGFRFADKPDYDLLVKLFRDLFIRKGYKFDGAYDWTPKNKVLSF